MITGKRLNSLTKAVRKELGATNAQRLGQIAEVQSNAEGELVLAHVFERLFPGQEKGKALDSFKKFRSSVNDAAEAVGSSLLIHVDKSKSGDLKKRRCWFTAAEEEENPELKKFADESSRLANVKGGQKSSARPSRPAFRPAFRIFVSYAHVDSPRVMPLLEKLKTNLKVQSMGRPYDIDLWIDTNILPGDQWLEGIRSELKKSHVGLVFLSPAALASSFVQGEEIPRLMRPVNDLGELKVCVPLMLEHFSFVDCREALGQLKERQIDRYTHTNFQNYAWDQCRTGPIKNGFVAAL